MPADQIRFLCNSCQARHSVPLTEAGHWHYCDNCGVHITVPQPGTGGSMRVAAADRNPAIRKRIQPDDSDDDPQPSQTRRWWQQPAVWVVIAVVLCAPPLVALVRPSLALPMVIGWLAGCLLLFLAAWLLGVFHAICENPISVIFFVLIPFYFIKYTVRHWPETRLAGYASILFVGWLTAPVLISFPLFLVTWLWTTGGEAGLENNRVADIETNADADVDADVGLPPDAAADPWEPDRQQVSPTAPAAQPSEITAPPLNRPAVTPPAARPVAAAVPDGFRMIQDGDVLPAGLPGVSLHGNEWVPCEILEINQHGLVMVRLLHDLSAFPHYANQPQLMQRSRTALAARPEDLQRAVQNPESFQPSVNLFPGTSIVLGPDQIVLPDDLPLVPGIPLLVARTPVHFMNMTLLSETQDERLICANLDHHGNLDALDRNLFAINTQVVADLADLQTAADKYASRVDDVWAVFDKRSQLPPREYRITMSLPRGFVRLDPDLQIPQGCALKAEWGHRWHDLTVVRDSPADAVLVYWNDWGGSWIYTLTRSSIIIDSELQQQLHGPTL